MKRRSKKLWSVLLTLALLLSLVPAMALTALAADPSYNLWVGGVEVTSENSSGTGWSYDAASNTLTLDGYSYEGAGHTYSEYEYYAAIYAGQDLTISITGTNTVTETSSARSVGIRADGELTITGSGTLTAAATGSEGSGSTGISAAGVTVEGGTVTATGKSLGISVQGDVAISGGEVTATGDTNDGIYTRDGDVTISGGKVTADGKGEYASGINVNGGDVTISDGTVIAKGNDNGVYTSGGNVTISGGKVTATGRNGIYSRGRMDYETNQRTGGKVTINSGTVTATSEGEDSRALSGDVSIGGGMEVKAGANEASAEPVTNFSDWEHEEKWVKVEEGFPVLYVGGVQVTADNTSGTGWSFAPETCTLTLDEYTFKGDQGEGYLYRNEDGNTQKAGIYFGGPQKTLTICLKGANSVACKNTGGAFFFGNKAFAIKSDKSILIRVAEGAASGTLTLSAIGSQAVALDAQNITLESGEVSVSTSVDGDFNKIAGCVYADNTLTVNGGKLTLQEKSSEAYQSIGIQARHVKLNGGALSIDAKKVGVLCKGATHEDHNTGERIVDEYGSFQVNGGVAEITAGEAAVELVKASYEGPFTATMTLGDGVTMTYGQSKTDPAVYDGDADKAYDVLKKIEDYYTGVVSQKPAKYVSFAPPVPYMAWDGEKLVEMTGNDACKAYTVVKSSESAVTCPAGWYVVNDTVTINGAVTLTGDVYVILCDTASLTVNENTRYDAVIYGEDSSLTLFAQSTGSSMGALTVTGGDDTPGISADYGVTINGGKVTVTGGDGIDSLSGNVTINGGTVNATATYGDGIYAYGGVTVNGGTVTATGTCTYGDGIYADGDVEITGGTVIASGDYNGIFADCEADITISGGNVNATATYDGIFTEGNVSITGGTVIASGSDDEEGHGICGAEITIGEAVTGVVASGPHYAFAYCDDDDVYFAGKVTNAIAGTGWTDVAGTTGKADIAVNADGQELSYKKVRFPEVAEPEVAPIDYGSYTPASVAPAATTVTVPVSGEDATVNVKVEIKGDTAAIKEADIDKVLEAEDVGTVIIDVSGLKASIDEVTIPGKMLDKIADAVADEDNSADGLEVKLPAGSVSFDADALAAIAEQVDGKDLTLHLDNVKVTELTSAQQGAVSDLEVEVVLDAYLTSNGQRISDFKGGSATVKIPYTLKDGQLPAGLVVWYVAEDGTRTQVPATYDGEYIVFDVPHFSNYVVAYDEALAAECPKDESCPLSAFGDLDAAAWYHDGVHFVLANGIMNGIGEGKFAPNDNTSRAMIVTILYRLEGEPMIRSGMPFSDVTESDWYAMAVSWAESQGIANGFEDGTFRPNDPITREQLAAMLYRYAQYKGEGFTGLWSFHLDFPDAGDVADWATEAMSWMVMNGIINGTTDDAGTVILDPQGDATRAQLATMVQRFCEYIKAQQAAE